MKKKILSLILAIAMVLPLCPVFELPVFAATSGYYTYTVSNGEATITDCDTEIFGKITIVTWTRKKALCVKQNLYLTRVGQRRGPLVRVTQKKGLLLWLK